MPPPDPIAAPRRIERADASRADEVTPILRAAFQETWPPVSTEATPLEYATWKMTGPPGAPAHPHTLVVEDNELVAVELRWLAWAHVGNELFPFDRGVDLAVLPDHQGRGLARAIFDDDFDRNTPLGNFLRWDTPSADARVLHLEEGDFAYRQLRSWVRAFQARTFVGVHRRAGIAHLARALAGAVVGRLRRSPPAPGYRLEPLVSFDERTDALWDRCRVQFDIARLRDAALLNWRYFDQRGGAADVIAAFEGDRVVGYVALKSEGDIGRITELVVEPGAHAAATALLEDASTRLRAAGCREAIAWLPPDHPEEIALRASSFIDDGNLRDVDLDYTWMSSAPAAVAIIRDPRARLHITMGDFDFV